MNVRTCLYVYLYISEYPNIRVQVNGVARARQQDFCIIILFRVIGVNGISFGVSFFLFCANKNKLIYFFSRCCTCCYGSCCPECDSRFYLKELIFLGFTLHLLLYIHPYHRLNLKHMCMRSECTHLRINTSPKLNGSLII